MADETEKTEGFIDLDAAEGGDEQRLHPILSNEEVMAAREKARKKLDAERRTNAMKAVEEAEVQRLRQEEGLTTGDGVKDEMVEITVDLAEHSRNITINGQPYWHGFTYTVPRHVADTLRETMARGWKHQDEADGKDLAQQFQAKRQFATIRKGGEGGAVLSKGGVSGVVPRNMGLRAGPEDHAAAAAREANLEGASI